MIVTSSVNGTRIFSNTGATAYSCTKAAQVKMTKMLALELAPQKVRVNVICPGAIETKIDESTEQRDAEHVRIRWSTPKAHSRSPAASPAAPSRWPTLCCFWPPTRPAISPAPSCGSTGPSRAARLGATSRFVGAWQPRS